MLVDKIAKIKYNIKYFLYVHKINDQLQISSKTLFNWVFGVPFAEIKILGLLCVFHQLKCGLHTLSNDIVNCLNKQEVYLQYIKALLNICFAFKNSDYNIFTFIFPTDTILLVQVSQVAAINYKGKYLNIIRIYNLNVNIFIW